MSRRLITIIFDWCLYPHLYYTYYAYVFLCSTCFKIGRVVVSMIMIMLKLHEDKSSQLSSLNTTNNAAPIGLRMVRW